MTAAVDGTAPRRARAPLWWILVRHEWRLTVRDIGGRSRKRAPGAKPKKPIGRKRRIFGYVAAAILLHLGGALSLALPHRWTDTQASRIAVVAVLVFLFTLMLSSAMSRVVSAFHERRDLDLLLGAPISPALILVIRALTVVVAVTILFATFLYPVVDVGVVSGRWWMARIYLLVPLMAMSATAVALALTGAVVRLIGVRRARVGLQIFSAIVGASFYLISQARQFLPAGITDRLMDRLRVLTRDEDVAWPIVVAAHLAAGDGWAWLAFVAIAIGLFAAAVWSARKRFAEVAQTPEADAPVVMQPRPAVDRRIRSGFARRLFPALLLKEWRLILRAPQLISQILLQLLYLMPLLFVAFGHKGSGMAWGTAAFAGGIVGVVGTLASSLAWLTVAAEDAPDLLAGSPKSRGVILSSKLVAATLPPIALLAIAALGTVQRSVVDAVVVFVFGSLACVSAAILSAASPSSGKRSDFQRRHQGRGLIAFAETMQFVLWAGAAGTAASGYWIVSAALTLVAIVMPAMYLPRALRGLDEVDR